MNDQVPNAEPQAARDLWLECMKAADKHGRLEKQPTIRPRTKYEQQVARTQNYWLTRASFGMPHGYDRIQWHHSLEDQTA